jgi:tetratricopeptide (TPR) repeat protein
MIDTRVSYIVVIILPDGGIGLASKKDISKSENIQQQIKLIEDYDSFREKEPLNISVLLDELFALEVMKFGNNKYCDEVKQKEFVDRLSTSNYQMSEDRFSEYFEKITDRYSYCGYELTINEMEKLGWRNEDASDFAECKGRYRPESICVKCPIFSVCSDLYNGVQQDIRIEEDLRWDERAKLENWFFPVKVESNKEGPTTDTKDGLFLNKSNVQEDVWIRYKTRGMSRPSRKSRIFFSANASDLFQFLNPIVSSILEQCDCAVFYDGTPETRKTDDELAEILDEVQMIVFPVTRKFFDVGDVTREFIIPYAKEKGIPLLPILQDESLENDFNKACGNLQCVKPTSPNDKVIQFEEKLSKFLQQVFLQKEIVSKIQEAFDAYIFLSYRRIDRKQAHRLVRLIHEREFCRDVAIWYDEFLTPGENFDEMIKKALYDSDLFALLITPNILSGDNYIVKYEYPMAVGLNKAIIPIEIEPTGIDLLNEKLHNLPECVNPENQSVFDSALRVQIDKIVKSKDKTSPEHTYFIGLAYLNGIDVEVNRTRAIELITEAAEEGLPEAMTDLISMYEFGNGVPKNINKAANYALSLTKVKKQLMIDDDYSSKGTEEYLTAVYTLVNMLNNDTSNEIDQLPGLSSCRSDMFSLIRQAEEAHNRLSQEEQTQETEVTYCKLLNIEGGNCNKSGESSTMSARPVLKARSILRGLSEQYPDNINLKLTFIDSSQKSGNIFSYVNGYGRAYQYYWESIHLAKELAATPGTARCRESYANCLRTVAKLLQRVGNKEQAMDCFQEALEIYKQLLEENNTLYADNAYEKILLELNMLNEERPK